MATLEVRSLTRYSPEIGTVTDDVSFTVRQGRIAALLGPTHTGKTSLLRLVAGLDRPDRGDVLLNDASVLHQPPHRRGVGMLFQELALFPNRTVSENVAFGLRMLGWPNADRDRRVAQLLEAVGLPAFRDAKIDSLDADDRQRVAIARAVAPQPSVLLLDEPLGPLDEAAKDELRSDLRALLTEIEITTVVATPDLSDAAALADDLIVMHEGRILQSGPLHVVLGGPASVEVAELLGYVTLAQGRLQGGRVEEVGIGSVGVAGLIPAGDAAVVMAHPGTILAIPSDVGAGIGAAGRVLRARPLGPLWLLDLAVGARVIEARWEWDLVPPLPGAQVEIAVPPGALRVFATDSQEIPAPPDEDETPIFVRPAVRSSTRIDQDEPTTALASEPSAQLGVPEPLEEDDIRQRPARPSPQETEQTPPESPPEDRHRGMPLA